ncbi:MAG: transcription antitermination factor NusB [Deltaproteobacteria bacterium]|nr:transcription antitermination factor NusB [Deltaproteobacteria bacterium]
MISCRRKAREAALQALYQCDALGEWSLACIDLYFQQFQSEGALEGESQEHTGFARMIIDGVISNFDFIDSQISAASKHWSLPRMCRVDRNLLRLAVYEIGFVPDIPVSVTINEAIEIAKRYCGDDAPMFVNGVLDNIATTFASDPLLKSKVFQKELKKAANS